jgi:hypothetical protein
MDTLLEFLETHTIYQTRVRANIVPPELRCRQPKTDPRMGFLRSKVPLRTMTVRSGPYFDACVAVLPPGFRAGAVTINQNVCCHPHRDKGNQGESLILFLGDFEGGALHVEDGRVFEKRGVWHRFDGGRLLHWNAPITAGTKYSVVAYADTPAFKSKIKNSDERENNGDPTG